VVEAATGIAKGLAGGIVESYGDAPGEPPVSAPCAGFKEAGCRWADSLSDEQGGGVVEVETVREGAKS